MVEPQLLKTVRHLETPIAIEKQDIIILATQMHCERL